MFKKENWLKNYTYVDARMPLTDNTFHFQIYEKLL